MSAAVADDRVDNRPSRPWRKRLLCLGVFFLLAYSGMLWHGGPRGRLIADIRSAGGDYSEWHAQSFYLRPFLSQLGLNDFAQYSVALTGPGFDDAWLAAHDDLSAIAPNCLSISGTQLTGASLQRLLRKHQFERLAIIDTPLSDAEAELLHDDRDLKDLTLRNTDVTDRGFQAVRLSRLYHLDVSGSPISSAGLQQGLAAKGLRSIELDGRQFTPELARFLGSMPNLSSITLVGPEVTDEQVELLRLLPRLWGISLDQTSVSAEAIESLRAAHPGRGITVDRVQVQSMQMR
jgi:hypothetical protein